MTSWSFLEGLKKKKRTARWLHSMCQADVEQSKLECYVSETDTNTQLVFRWLASPVSTSSLSESRLALDAAGPQPVRKVGPLRRPFATQKNRPAT